MSLMELFSRNSRKNYFKMSSSRSSSEKEYKEGGSDIKDPDIICGFGNFRPKWLQSWATPEIYLVLLSITGIVNETYSAYHVGVMPTLERRFVFEGKTTGAITLAIDKITLVLFGVLVGYCGGRTHRPRVLGLGAFLSALCCFTSALPYFIYGPAMNFGDLNSTVSTNGSDLQLCEDRVLEACVAVDHPPTSVVVGLWTVAGILKGLGTLTYYTVGLSYMDDNAKKMNSSMYFAIAVVLRLFGPVLGVWMSSICLKYFENPLDDPGYGPDDPCWVGGWWMGFVVQGLLLLLVTLPLVMFPKNLPGFKKPLDRPETDKETIFSGMSVAVKRNLLNPLLYAIMMNDVVSAYGAIAGEAMLPKYMEEQFRMTTSDTSLYSELPGKGAVMVSGIIGGFLIWKFRPSMKFILGAMILAKSIGGCGYLTLMIPKCEKLEMANFGMDNGSLILDGACNMNCNCTRKSFTPVCGSDRKTLYFSPCYAGCEQSFNETFFNNCSCITESVNLENYTTEGFCMPESCWLQAIAYIIAWPTIQFILSILMVMQTLMLLRSTRPQDKSLALGIFEAVKSIPGIVPYLIIFGPMLDPACLVWESDKSGNCCFYDSDKLSKVLHGTSAGLSFLSAGTMCVIFGLRGRFYDLYEEDVLYEEIAGDTKVSQIAELAINSSLQEEDSLEVPKITLERVISCRICLRRD